MKRAMNPGLAGLCAVVLAVASASARGEVTSTVTVASDYDFRGISQNALGAAVQASLDWSGEGGLYAGLWGSNVDFGDGGPNVEADLLLGYAGAIAGNLGYDIGATYYKYLGAEASLPSVDYYEIRAGLSFAEYASTAVWYAPDYANSSEGAWYAEANGNIPLPWELGIALHAGYSGGDYWKSDTIGLDEFFDYSVGLARTFGHFDTSVKFVDGSDLKVADGTPDDIFTSESKVVFSIATTFPWARKE
jgi:uncharacterized protein (TIGR02001 family)